MTLPGWGQSGLPAALLFGLLAVLPGATTGQTPSHPLRDPYLREPRGPYRGRVLDAETQAPLVGAVVVAAWDREIVYPLGSNTVKYRAREVLTGADGTFVIDAREVEDRAPARTLRPLFVIFFPGYELFQRTYEKFEGPGATVALRKLASWKERDKVLGNPNPWSLSARPGRELPHLMRLVNEERGLRGLGPLYDSEEKQP